MGIERLRHRPNHAPTDRASPRLSEGHLYGLASHWRSRYAAAAIQLRKATNQADPESVRPTGQLAWMDRSHGPWPGRERA